MVGGVVPLGVVGVDRVPGVGGEVSAVITLSAGNNNTRVTLNHRTFVASAIVDTLP